MGSTVPRAGKVIAPLIMFWWPLNFMVKPSFLLLPMATTKESCLTFKAVLLKAAPLPVCLPSDLRALVICPFPSGVPPWSSIVTEVPAEDTLTPDQEWEWFNTALEKVFVLTQKDANNAHTRPKGSGPVLVPSHDTRVGGFRHGSYRERTLRKLLGRIHEANRQFYAAGNCDPVLVTKIFRNWPQHIAWTTWQEAPEHIAQELQLRSRRSLQVGCLEGKKLR